MPELPEVETIRSRLAPLVEGRTLRTIDVLDAKWCSPLAPEELADALQNRPVVRLGRRGKYLIWEWEDEVFLLGHLRMTGTLLLDPPAGVPPHTRVVFTFDGDRRLTFVDPRRFGTGELAIGHEALDAFLAARLGVEPFDAAFTPEHLRSLALRSRAPIKAFLLDQRKIAGVGNIYADEALFRARLHPLMPARRLTRPKALALRDAVVEALQLGLDSKGASIDDFRDPDGVRGSFQDRFLVHLREGKPCPNCGTAVRKLRAAGRGTYVCEGCQPRPRYAASARSERSPSRSARTSS